MLVFCAEVSKMIIGQAGNAMHITCDERNEESILIMKTATKMREPDQLHIVYRPIDDLIPYAANARTHSPEQIEQIAASIKKFGFTNSILLDGKNGIICGHGRVKAASLIGMVMVPTIELAHLSDAQKRAYIIADNKLALNAGWDEDLLKLELGALLEDGFDLELIGFSDDELNWILNDPTQGLTDPDAVPPLQEVAISQPGDVWLLGKHRLVCGDCTDLAVVNQALNGVKPHLMVTDPPYGVEYDPTWRIGAHKATGGAMGKVLNDDRADWREAWALFPGNVAYVWHGGLYCAVVAESLAAVGLVMRSQIIWVKNRAVLSRGNYHWQHETALYAQKPDTDDNWRFGDDHEVFAYAVRAGSPAQWNGSRKQTTVWFIDTVKNDTGHSTQKPVECMRRPIENNSSPGQAIYDPFSGSGTTLIAAEQTGRCCHAIELNPYYVDVAIRRWQAFVGNEAIHEETGRTFAECELAGTRARKKSARAKKALTV
jgi:DNA modification methylase